MIQYKIKSKKINDVNTGLLDYPILMASDVLLYDTNFVPVGNDQKQHIELISNIAKRFNNLFGEVFTLPKAIISKSASRIMALDNPTIKMSKSIGNEKAGHMINLLDDEKIIKKTIMSSVTDSNNEMNFINASPGIKNLILIIESLSGENRAFISEKFKILGYKSLKEYAFELIMETLKPIQKKYNKIIKEHCYLDSIIKEGKEKVSLIAKSVMKRIRSLTGIGL
jgi:tryptophanyl-tRNA synthetase